MYSIPWYVAIFESIPETLLVILLGAALFNISINLSKAIEVSVLSAAIAFIIRLLPLPFGAHTIVGLIVISFLLWHFVDLSWLVSFVCTLAGLVFLLVIQSITIPILFPAFEIEYADLVKQPWLNVLLFIPQGIIMAITVIFLNKKNIYLYNFYEKA